MTDEATVWRSLADLLPPAPARQVMDRWSIGEQESALDLAVSALLEHDIPISASIRAQLAVASEMWGQREALEERIGRCRADGDVSALRLLALADAVPLTGASVSERPELADLLVVPWIRCAVCEQVLGRAHEREPWGGLSFLAARYVLFRPEAPAQAQVFGSTSVWEALTVLASCPGDQPAAHLRLSHPRTSASELDFRG
ncbi:hypothetical protein [Streptomyces carpinensis]|uniref:hypothetical protein n=1 Tax=Streptomyces carpinensis TaxID=66369 RepID=UPI00117D2911|nr:hypothetical protein [Streptomyces carpinensis]